MDRIKLGIINILQGLDTRANMLDPIRITRALVHTGGAVVTDHIDLHCCGGSLATGDVPHEYIQKEVQQ